MILYCRPESEFLTTIVLLSDDLDRLYELCLSCLSNVSSKVSLPVSTNYDLLNDDVVVIIVATYLMYIESF